MQFEKDVVVIFGTGGRMSGSSWNFDGDLPGLTFTR